MRVKSYESIQQKLYRDGVIDYAPETFEPVQKDVSFINMYDLIGGKVVVKGSLKDLERVMREFDSKCISYEEWSKKINEEKTALNGQINNAKIKSVKEQLKVERAGLLYREANLIDSSGKYIVFRKENRYLSQLGNDVGGHFRGTNYVIAVGQGKNTIELQFHRFLTALYDVDHDFIYKGKILGLPKLKLEDDVLKTIWVAHIISGLKYVYEGSKKGRKDVTEFINDRAEAARSTGGIDVRHVEEALDINGQQRPELAFTRSNGSFDPVEGFSPVIVSITSLEGLPFLKKISSN